MLTFTETIYIKIRKIGHTFLVPLPLGRFLSSVVFMPLDLAFMILHLLLDDRVIIWSKLEIFLGCLYVLIPDDLIPDYLIGYGWLDDLFVVIVVLQRLFKYIEKLDEDIFLQYWLGDLKFLGNLRQFLAFVRRWRDRIIVVGAIGVLLMRLFS